MKERNRKGLREIQREIKRDRENGRDKETGKLERRVDYYIDTQRQRER